MTAAVTEHLRPLSLLSIVGLIAAAATSTPLRADDVVLRSGVRFRDVKTEPSGHSHRILFRDGRVQVVPNAQIRSLRPAPTTWTKAVPPEPQHEPAAKPVEPVPVAPVEPDPPATDIPAVPETNTAPENGPIPDSRPELPAKNGIPWTPVLKSAILPGWGQYSLGREQTGALYAATSLFILQRYWTYRQRHATAEAEYNDPVPVGAVASQTLTGGVSLLDAAATNLIYLSDKERKVHSLEKQGNSMVLAFTLIWGWNMLDILYTGSPWSRERLNSRTMPPRAIPVVTLQKDSITAAVVFCL